MEQISLIRPDDWHCHFRDNEFLTRTVPDAAYRFGRAIVMPNLSPPVTSLDQVKSYRDRILLRVPENTEFNPLMTLYLTEQLTVETLKAAKATGLVTACKLYPAGATTHSAHGISQIERIYPLLACMEAIDLPLLIHGESIEAEVDIFDREKRFIDHELTRLLANFPNLRMVLEHISTQEAVHFVQNASPRLAATITPHHLWFNRNALFTGGIKPHYYCMPILKRQRDQEALVKAATSGHSKFFLGTDSAPHPQQNKETACGCAGIYSAFSAIEIYTQIFAEHNALDQLEKFASLNGANFYHLKPNPSKITLIKKPWKIPQQLAFGNTILIPMLAGETLAWQLSHLVVEEKC